MNVFLSTYSMCSGEVSLEVACDNHADITDIDFLTSCSIHTLLIATMQAVRWKHYLYDNYLESNGNIIDTENIKFHFEDIFVKVLTYPYIFWIIWAVIYFILNAKTLRKYVYNDIY